MTLKLYTPIECQQFIKNFPDEFASYGCGPGGIGDYFVPDTIYGLDIKPCCQRHDWSYRHSEKSSEKDRKEHDTILIFNIVRTIDYHTRNKILRALRFHRGTMYYHGVRLLGGPSYWNDRNDTAEMMSI